MTSISPHLPKHNFVKLSSIDDDALGKDIEVLWELKTAAHVVERAGLPTISALDDPSKLEAFLDAVRRSPASNSDRGQLQAPFHSGVSIEDYQLDPLVRPIDIRRTNLLIADNVALVRRSKPDSSSRSCSFTSVRGPFSCYARHRQRRSGS